MRSVRNREDGLNAPAKDALIATALAVATRTDLKRMEIPLWLFPSTVLIYVAATLSLGGEIGVMNWTGLVCMAVPFLIMTLIGKMGGGDLIMFSALGFMMGLDEMIPYWIALTAVGTAAAAVSGFGKKEIPIAPIAGAAYVVYFIWRVVVYGI